MIRLQGSLLVRKIKGRNGPFCVADLVTDVGEFKVKDALLDQFDEGTYQGEFFVSEFFLASYTTFGRAVTEIRVRLADLHIGDSTELPAQARRDPVEPDPAEEEPLHPPRRADDADTGRPARRTARQKARKTEADEEAADIELFGERALRQDSRARATQAGSHDRRSRAVPDATRSNARAELPVRLEDPDVAAPVGKSTTCQLRAGPPMAGLCSPWLWQSHACAQRVGLVGPLMEVLPSPRLQGGADATTGSRGPRPEAFATPERTRHCSALLPS